MHCKPVLILEQIGQYGCKALMIFPLLVWEFGFKSLEAIAIWTALCVVRLLSYFICWSLYSVSRPARRHMDGDSAQHHLHPSWRIPAPLATDGVRRYLRHWAYIHTWFNNKREVEGK